MEHGHEPIRPALPAPVLLAAAPAARRLRISAYTDINLDDCTIMETSDFGTVWACPGHKGYPVRIAEGDLRFFVSYGFGADDEPAAGADPAALQHARPQDRVAPPTPRAPRPVATIIRYFASKRGRRHRGPGPRRDPARRRHHLPRRLDRRARQPRRQRARPDGGRQAGTLRLHRRP